MNNPNQDPLSGSDQAAIAAMKGPANKGWRYSMIFGVMYGNVPVGIIVVAVAFLIYAATR